MRIKFLFILFVFPINSLHASTITWQLIVNGGYGFSPKQNYMGIGYSKPAFVDTNQLINFKEK